MSTPLIRAIRLWLVTFAAIVGLAAGAAAAGGATPLVSADWLKSNLQRGDLVILDIRSALDGGGAAAYAKAHIPGAIHSDYDKGGWRVTRDGVPFMLPSVAQLETLISGLGVREDSHVVVVPAGVHALDFGAAARVYWTLKASGVEKVSILDGGFAAWAADASNPVESGNRAPTPEIFTVKLNRRYIAETSDVEQVQRQGGATLLDARPASFFHGKQKAPAAKAYGHIPGAVNLAHETFYDAAANRLKPQATLASLAASVPGGPIVSYCNTGHWAATNWFVLSEVLGRDDVRLYYGSMVDWTSAPGRAITSARTKFDDLKKALGLGS